MKIKTLALSALFIAALAGRLQAAADVKLKLVYDGRNHEYSAPPITLIINGRPADGLKMPPIIMDGSTLVPARDVFEQLGASVSWNAEAQAVEVTKAERVISLKINETQARVDGAAVSMSIPPKIINDKTMIPLRFVADNLGFLVNWDGERRAVYIDDVSDVSALGDKSDLAKEDAPPPAPASADLAPKDASAGEIKAETHPDANITGLQTPGVTDNTYKIIADGPVSKVTKNLLGDNRMYIDIYGAALLLGTSGSPIENDPNVISVRVAQNQTSPEKIVRAVFELRGGTEYYISLSEDRKIITVGFSHANPVLGADNAEPAAPAPLPSYPQVSGVLSHIGYDYENRRVYIEKTSGLSAADLAENDDYLSLRYELTLPGDFSAYFGQGRYAIGDSYLSGVTIEARGGKTVVTMNEARILAYNLSEDERNIYVKPVLPKEKYPRIVVIDPGHGAEAPGTMGNGLIEREVNLDVAQRLHSLIESGGKIKVYSTRLTDVNPGLEERGVFGTNYGDLFVSIHNNYAEVSPGVANTEVRGTETYYYPHDNDNTIGISSEAAAGIMQTALVSGLGSYDRQVRTNSYVVLMKAQVPAVLCELGFFSNPEEAAKLASSEYRDKCAAALYDGILKIFAQYSPRR
ncbi:MAG: N-acetylmuramoyl-L-alanine amidase family protein [Clostridiales bacterium]|nr:N-acetylmuramoyl-L-alanine amidase family protein [Clostridiales bacterium]